MASDERLREVGRMATEHYNRRWRPARLGAPPSYRLYQDGLKVWIDDARAPIRHPMPCIRMIMPFARWENGAELMPIDGADFGLYRRLLKFFEVELGWWVGQDRGHFSYRDGIWKAIRHGGADRQSKLRVEFEVKSNGQMEIGFYQDGLIGIGRKNGARHSIETHKVECLAPDVRRRYVYAVWRLERWCVAQGLLNNTELGRGDFDDPEELIEYWVRQSGHHKGEETIRIPRKTEHYNHTDATGKRIVNGDVKWFYKEWADGAHHLMRGVVYHNLNNMWWTIVGGYVHNMASFQLFDWTPGLPRRHVPHTIRVRRLEAHLARLVAAEDFERAVGARDALKRLKAAPGREDVWRQLHTAAKAAVAAR